MRRLTAKRPILAHVSVKHVNVRLRSCVALKRHVHASLLEVSSVHPPSRPGWKFIAAAAAESNVSDAVAATAFLQCSAGVDA